MTFEQIFTKDIDKLLGELLLILTFGVSALVYYIVIMIILKFPLPRVHRLLGWLIDLSNNLYHCAQRRFGHKVAQRLDFSRIAVLAAVGVVVIVFPPIYLSAKFVDMLFGFTGERNFLLSDAYYHLVNLFSSIGFSIIWSKIWAGITGIGEFVGGITGLKTLLDFFKNGIKGLKGILREEREG